MKEICFFTTPVDVELMRAGKRQHLQEYGLAVFSYNDTCFLKSSFPYVFLNRRCRNGHYKGTQY